MGMQYTYIVHGMGRGGEEEDNFVLQYGKLCNAAKKLLYTYNINMYNTCAHKTVE